MSIICRLYKFENKCDHDFFSGKENRDHITVVWSVNIDLFNSSIDTADIMSIYLTWVQTPLDGILGLILLIHYY